jgi:hypothetical protein
MDIELNHKHLEYFPLSMYKVRPTDFADHTYELRNHVGKVKSKLVKKRDDLHLPEGCLLHYGKENSPVVMICITMYNEPFIQLLQSLAGVYRSYYELCSLDEKFVNRVHICIIADGYDKMEEEFLLR